MVSTSLKYSVSYSAYSEIWLIINLTGCVGEDHPRTCNYLQGRSWSKESNLRNNGYSHFICGHHHKYLVFLYTLGNHLRGVQLGSHSSAIGEIWIEKVFLGMEANKKIHLSQSKLSILMRNGEHFLTPSLLHKFPRCTEFIA